MTDMSPVLIWNQKTKNMTYKPKVAITFHTLKDFVNRLEQWQLDCPVNVWGDGHGFHIDDANQLEKDYYLKDEVFDPVSTCDNDISEYEIIKKGTPLLFTDRLCLSN